MKASFNMLQCKHLNRTGFMTGNVTNLWGLLGLRKDMSLMIGGPFNYRRPWHVLCVRVCPPHRKYESLWWKCEPGLQENTCKCPVKADMFLKVSYRHYLSLIFTPAVNRKMTSGALVSELVEKSSHGVRSSPLLCLHEM